MRFVCTSITREDPQPKVTADNEPFRTEGIASQQFRFAGDDTVFEHDVCVVSKPGVMSILGTDFWSKYRAIKDYGANQITIDKPGANDGGATRITIPMRTHAGQARVSTIRPKEMVQTQCRAMEDMVIPPGECREVGAPMAIDMEVGALNAGMLFQAVAAVQCAGGPAMYYEGDGP